MAIAAFRELQMPFIVGLFVAAYATIVTERLHRTVAALAAGGLAVALGVLSQRQAVSAVDWNTLSLLIGMMVLVRVLSRTGLFQAVGYATVTVAGQRPMQLLFAFSVLTAVTSALLDNVTTILVLAPITIAAAEVMGVDPIPFAFAEVLASNIGGTATLIGDPPNMMIGGAAGLSFGQFLSTLGPICAVVLAATLAGLAVVFRGRLRSQRDASTAIAKPDIHPQLLPRSVAIFLLTVAGLTLHPFGLHPGVIAILGATAALVLLPHEEVEEVLRELDWGTVFFFAGLYVLVGALVQVGAVGYLAHAIVAATGSDRALLMQTVLWVSAVLSSVVDNVPWAAAMIPVIHRVGAGAPAASVNPLWWALALGTCLGGNGTLIGASANVVMAGILARKGHPFGFWRFLRVAFPLMLVSITLSAVGLHVMFGA